MKHLQRILSAVVLSSSFLPSASWSVPAPTSLTIRSGYLAFENLSGDTHPASLSISSAWDLGKQTALWMSIGYTQERARFASNERILPLSFGYTRSPGERVRTNLVPISAGLRAYANSAQHRSRGLFVEAGPSLYGASYLGADDANHLAALAGFQCGMGVRFAGVYGSRFELGGSYSLAEAIGKYPRAVGRLGTPQDVDYHLFSVYLGVGFGN